jgi:hypothetical protein
MHTPLTVKIYVINPKAFPRYLERGNATSILLVMNNTLPITWAKIIQPMVFYRIPQCRYCFPILALIGLCNTFGSVKTYVINPKTFPRYLNRGIGCSSQLVSHEQYPF